METVIMIQRPLLVLALKLINRYLYFYFCVLGVKMMKMVTKKSKSKEKARLFENAIINTV